MVIQERKLRVWGYLVFSTIFFLFFLLEMFFSWKDPYMFWKVIFLTVTYSIAMWEPSRKVILQQRRKYPGVPYIKKRITLFVLKAIPFSILLACTRLFLEDLFHFWSVQIASISMCSFVSGYTFLFVVMQALVYEGMFFMEEYSESRTEIEKMRRLNVQMQMDSLKVQIQPHFLFNTLNTLIGLIEVNKEKAIRFTEDLAFVYRYLLEANTADMIALEDELMLVKTYFSLLKTRYTEGLILIDNINYVSGFELPPLSLQILIENAVKHNTITRGRPLTITICIDEEERRIKVKNNLQPKNVQFRSGHGLSHLGKKFDLMGLPAVKILNEFDFFVVSIPLVKKHRYESVNH
jgi:hypothetical protein